MKRGIVFIFLLFFHAQVVVKTKVLAASGIFMKSLKKMQQKLPVLKLQVTTLNLQKRMGGGHLCITI